MTTLQLSRSNVTEDGYLRYVKDSCFVKGEAISCVKYKGLKVIKETFFGDNNNETITTNLFSLVPLDVETIKSLGVKKTVRDVKPRGFLSEWAEFAKYLMRLVQDFLNVKGLKVEIPEGARTVEEETTDDGRGKKKKLAVVIPLLTLLAVIKSKFLLLPILLAVMLIKKLLLAAAFLLPNLLSTLKACKHHSMPHYSYFGSSDSSDFNSDYGSSYAYSSGAGGKDWASNRAYSPKNRPSPAPMYITAPGAVA
ncbi:uncharacterized protein LOC114253034 [Bombyx mandarina]|uniref:Uncharacterized protein LOC114253034 n=1 Tax=Bombyx mandarina TaxID=7092 RepID=A0A6J2KMN4_BOMMA|nr:uncharacterized protein LOC114253034 [Bombyx mandarina]